MRWRASRESPPVDGGDQGNLSNREWIPLKKETLIGRRPEPKLFHGGEKGAGKKKGTKREKKKEKKGDQSGKNRQSCMSRKKAGG